jgi:hypothetical protein
LRTLKPVRSTGPSSSPHSYVRNKVHFLYQI